MQITKYSHACLRLERDGVVLVVDPGIFSERAALDGADAVLVTHEHPDHLDLDAWRAALAIRPDLPMYTNEALAAVLASAGGSVHPVSAGDRFEAAGIPVQAYGGWHAVIHPDLPRVPNLGFLIDESLYHPGDSFEVPLGASVQTLFVPVSAPWLSVGQAVDFVRAVAPQRAYALHDHLLSAAGHQLTDGLMTSLCRAPYARLAAGEQITG